MSEGNNYCVYKHTSPSGKVYIGQTSINPLDRWQNGKGYKKQAFYNAIKKYGWENIKHEILYDNLTKEEATKKEIEMISFYKSTNKNFGYNISPGGEDGYNELWNDETYRTAKIEERKRRWDDDDYRERHKKSMEKAMNNPSYKNKQAKRTKERWENGEFKDIFCKKVLCLETGIVYESSKKAHELTGICRTDINKCCNKQMLTANGYHWVFYNNEKYTEEERKQLIDAIGFGRGVKIICVETGKKYKSIKDASIDNSIDNSAIGKVLKGKQKTAGGYHWEYDNEKAV